MDFCALERERRRLGHYIDPLISYNYESDVCPLDCFPISASRSLPALSGGTYTVVHGSALDQAHRRQTSPSCF